jgi:PAT family beta-lactamase induction signal transducer AmpG
MSGGAGDRPGLPYLVLFAALYAIQGIVIAYFFNFNQPYMRAGGVSDATIGTVSTIALIPLILRFLGGPLSDRINLFGLGHRRPYIVLGLAMQSLGLLGLSRVHPGDHLAGFTALAVLTVLGLALYDTATDGMILDSTGAEARTRIQGLFIAARFLAATATSAGFGLWLRRTGEGPGRGDAVLWACAGLGMVPLTLALALPEPPHVGKHEGFRWEALGVMVRPRSLVLLAFGTLYAIVAYAIEINLSPYYHRLGFDAGDVGLFGATRYVGRAIGAVLVGLAMRRLGRGAVLITGIVMLAASAYGQTAIPPNATGMLGRVVAGAMALAFGLANGWNDALFYVLAMEASDPRMAASTCALFMSVTNLSVTGGGIFSWAVAAFGGRYAPAFRAAACVVLLALVLVPPLVRPMSPTPRDDRDA